MHQQAAGGNINSRAMPYPSMPTSPTLTNPEMILPYGEYDSISSPLQHQLRPDRRNGPWKGSPAAMDFSANPSQIGMAIGPLTPTTPIIYGNGTMLSDIGEVTEAETTPVRKLKSVSTTTKIQRTPVQANISDINIRSSPTVGYEAIIKRSKVGNHQRQVSVESTSTIRTEPLSAEMHDAEEFDDDISIGDSNFQGDDEESIADSTYETQVADAQAALVMRKDSVKRIMQEDGSPSGQLSKRAELILANAKKRLDSMEGNLSRARSSSYITPSSSMSSINSISRSTPSPSTHRGRPYTQMNIPPTRQRQLDGSTPFPAPSPGHGRLSSESSISSGMRSVSAPVAPRPISAIGGDNLIPLRLVEQSRFSSSSSIETLEQHQDTSLSSSRTATPLGTLGGDREATIDSPFRRPGDRAVTADPLLQTVYDNRGLTRSTSSLQMRDLTDKVKELRGKVSNLRDRAREDNMKRRSLQSLRSQSPFAASDNWSRTYSNHKANLKAQGGLAFNPWNGSETGDDTDFEELRTSAPRAEDEESEVSTIYEDMQDSTQANRTATMQNGYGHDLGTTDKVVPAPTEGTTQQTSNDYADEFIDQDELDDYASESDTSLYHNSRETPLSHEDREDAFDYEHFFLHSAMGTISQQNLRRRGSTGSFESDGSVATARGPSPPPSQHQITISDSRTARGHLKNQRSTDSVSTMNTFATATEGYTPEEESIPEVETEDEFYKSQDNHSSVLSPVMEERPATSNSIIRSASGDSPTSVGRPERPWASGNSSGGSRPASSLGDFREGKRLPHSQRPSVSSFASSNGTQRSFPLVNKPKTTALSPSPASNSGSRPTSSSSSPIKEHVISSLSEPLRFPNDEADGRVKSPTAMARQDSDNASVASLIKGSGITFDDGGIGSVAALSRGDQVLVERLVASLGKSVLGLQDAHGGSVESRMWRRRLEVARRVLEGEGGI